MLTLYFAPGASSMAVHVALHEIGVPFEACPSAGEAAAIARYFVDSGGESLQRSLPRWTVCWEGVEFELLAVQYAPQNAATTAPAPVENRRRPVRAQRVTFV